MSNEKKLYIAWIILLAAWFTMTIIPFLDVQTGRLFADYYDRLIYFERGRWFTENTTPISEYPQIPTILFGINHLTSMWFDINLQTSVYVAFFSFEMILVLFFILKVLLDILPSDQSNYAFLMLLPPTIYFAYNRFDILPTFMCLIAYSASIKKQWIFVSFILAIATFTKWYPVLLFPGFLMYATQSESKFQWKMVFSFSITSIAILLFSYLQGGTETILTPFKFHIARNMEFIALPVLVDNWLQSMININLPNYFLLFFILQISAPVLIFFIKLDSLDALTHYCIVVIGTFVLFSRIWSPQWFLWLMPFLIISTKNIKGASLIIAYNFITYLSFLLMFDFYGYSSNQLKISGLLTFIILSAIILKSAKNLRFSNALKPENLRPTPRQH